MTDGRRRLDVSRDLHRDVVSLQTEGKGGAVDNVRRWEEGGKRVAVYEGQERSGLDLYQSGRGDASACGSEIGG
jgi:hypothetical protein